MIVLPIMVMMSLSVGASVGYCYPESPLQSERQDGIARNPATGRVDFEDFPLMVIRIFFIALNPPPIGIWACPDVFFNLLILIPFNQ
jgi:hypothetical protein